MRRKDNFIVGEHYHIFNRGNNKDLIFWEDYDRARFLTLLLFCQGTMQMQRIVKMAPSVSSIVKSDGDLKSFVSSHGKKLINQTLNSRIAILRNFCLMPTHFHAEFQEIEAGGISKLMQRLGNSYTRYLNIKYKRSGHIFSGTFKSVHISDNDQLLNTSVYIHSNPRELKYYKGKEQLYPWSSFKDYIGENRWGDLLDGSLILGQFVNGEEYKKFVDESDTKLIDI